MRVAVIIVCIILVALLSVALVVFLRSPVAPGPEPGTTEVAEAQEALAQAEFETGPDSAEVAAALEGLAGLLIRHGRYPEAREQFDRALAIRLDVLDESGPVVASTLDGLAEAQWNSGDLTAAKGSLERAIRIRKEAAPGDPVAIARTQHRLGIVRKNLGEYATARTDFLEAAAVFEAELGPDDPQLVKSWNMLGIVARRTGDWKAGARYFDRAYDLALRTLGEEDNLVALVLMNHGNLLVDAGQQELAIPYLERSLEISKKILGPDNPDLAHRYNNLARCLLEMGAFEEAIPLAERALALWESAFGEDHFWLSSAVDNLAGLNMIALRLDRAEELYQRSLAMRRRVYGPEHPEVAESLIHMANFRWVALRDAKGAVEFALDGEAIARRQFRRIAGGLTEEEALRFEAIRYSGFNIALTVLAGDAEVGEELEARAWDQLIRSRALVLDEMAARRRFASQAVSTDLAPRLEALRSARKTLAELVLRGPDSDHPARYVESLERAKQARDRAERELADASRVFRESQRTALAGAGEVMAALPADAALVAYVEYQRTRWFHDEPDPGEVSLDEEEAGGSDRVMKRTPAYLAFVTRPGRPLPEIVPLGPAKPIEILVQEWRRGAGTRPPSLRAAARRAEVEYRENARELRRRIWDPVVAATGDAKRIFVVPDGMLHLVGLSSLPTDDDRYLLESGPLLHHLSTERDLLRHVRPAARPGSGLLALGGPDFDWGPMPLSGAEARPGRGATAKCAELAEIRFESLPASIPEVTDLAALWERETAGDRGEARVLTGARATEESVKRLAPGTRVVHLATHGFFGQDRCASSLDRARESETLRGQGGESPLLLSGLAFAGANRRRDVRNVDREEDGILTAEEIASLDLTGVEWVVLSACETGVGQVQSGEGVLGLRRAFETAGAGTLIMSLWQVEDEATREWMGHLYRERLQGRSTAEAVRRAGLAMIRARRAAGVSAHPFAWGAFVAAGDWH